MPRLSARVTAWDAALALSLLAVTVIVPFSLRHEGEGSVLEVRVGDDTFRYPLGVDGTRVLSGPIGEAQLVVQDGRATLRNACCPLKVCEAMGALSHPGDAIICVPNRIVVSVAGRRNVDAVSR